MDRPAHPPKKDAQRRECILALKGATSRNKRCRDSRNECPAAVELWFRSVCSRRIDSDWSGATPECPQGLGRDLPNCLARCRRSRSSTSSHLREPFREARGEWPRPQSSAPEDLARATAEWSTELFP